MPTAPTQNSRNDDAFPDFEEVEYEKSTLTLPLHSHGRFVEELRLDALLQLRRFEPREVLGRRQFEFKIEKWEVAGKSEKLRCSFGFKLSDGPQPKSLCIADQPSADYPAIIIYNAIYDIYVRGECVLRNQTGLGVGVGVTEIPPRGITVSFQKPFGVEALEVRAGDCKAMAPLSESEWIEELDRIVAIRNQP